MRRWEITREGGDWLSTVGECRTFWQRLRGYLGNTRQHWEALWFPDATSLHTCFMAFDLDILFLDGQHVVLERHLGVGPRRWVSCPGAASVLELPTGGALIPNVGETLEFKRCDDS